MYVSQALASNRKKYERKEVAESRIIISKRLSSTKLSEWSSQELVYS